MCFAPKPRVDTTVQEAQVKEAADARAAEEARQARIRAGNASIDTAFSGFDDNFYGGKAKAYSDYYMPQVEDKFADARKNLTFALARAGTLNSSIAGEKNADLLKQYELQRATIQNQATSEANALRTRIGNEKSTLVSQLNATGDADRAANEATSRTQMLFNEAPSYNPLGDIFSGVAAGIVQWRTAQQNEAILAAGGVNSPRRSASTYVG
jgi:hypothetical protein